MSIIRDQLYISEDYRINEGLIEFESASLKDDLNKVRQSAVVAIVGDYGSGKSTALYNIQQGDTTSKWLQFDAWRYPERKGLWDGLVIEIAKQLGQDKKTTRKIDGNKSLFGKWGGIFNETFSQFGEFLPKNEVGKIEIDPAIAEKATKITQKAQDVFGRSPVKRVYELERILADILVSIKEERVHLVVEDVDRSGADGLNFLETLSFFVKHNEQIKRSGKTIVVIAPIATKNYEESKDSYYKCVDIAFSFAPKVKSATEFLKQVLTDEALGGTARPFLDNLNMFVIGLLESTKYGINVRKLKAILRQSAIKYETLNDAYENVDWRAVLAFEAMKYATDDSIATSQTVFQRRVAGHSQLPQKDVFTGLLMTIHEPSEPIYTYRFNNRRLPEDRIFNPRIQSYKFLDYRPHSHGHTSVWMGQDESGFEKRGFVAEYYRR